MQGFDSAFPASLPHLMPALKTMQDPILTTPCALKSNRHTSRFIRVPSARHAQPTPSSNAIPASGGLAGRGRYNIALGCIILRRIGWVSAWECGTRPAPAETSARSVAAPPLGISSGRRVDPPTAKNTGQAPQKRCQVVREGWGVAGSIARRASTRSYADLDRDRWIQSPERKPLRRGTR